MSTLFLSLVASHGAILIGLVTFLSCLALPIPASLVMLAGGAFAASGDLSLSAVASAALAGAVLGDQAGFHAGRAGAPRLTRWLGRSPERAAAFARARAILHRRGGPGVFFSTWLFAPLGPWVNLAAGAAGMGRLRFTLWDTAGETVWVTLYVGLGWIFAPRLLQVADLAGNTVGALTAALVALLLLRLLRHR